MAPPISTELAIAIALAHHRAGRLPEAEGIYQQIISREPGHAGALESLGVLAMQTGRLDTAAALFRRALAAEPDKASAFTNLGSCLRRLGKSDEAIAAFRMAVRLQPQLAVAHNNLGIALAEKVELDEAIASYRRAIELDPGYAEAHIHLANVLKDAGQLREALEAAHGAIGLQPHSAPAHNTLGAILAAAGQFDAAIPAYQRAIESAPRYGDAWSNLGNALAAEGDHAAALQASARAVELEPESLQSHWNYAVMLLRSGDLENGWREYEWRWKTQPSFPRPSPRYYPPRFATPHWDGRNLGGRTILLHAEQGFGDTLHFCRYAPLVAERGGRIVLEVQPELRRLMQTLAGVQRVMVRGETPPAFDEHCPLMSLPLAFNTTLQSIPAACPYLHADPALAAVWEKRVQPAPGRLNIGVCWAGSVEHADDAERSIPLAVLAPLARAGAAFHSLQKGAAALQIHSPPEGMTLVDHSALLADFADTAALIANLDLVITVDTAVAHLAGALGKPVWVLVRSLCDWRWLIGRWDTPWYPTMRLFRQEKRGDWNSVVEQVARALGGTAGPRLP